MYFLHYSKSYKWNFVWAELSLLLNGVQEVMSFLLWQLLEVLFLEKLL